MSRTTRKKDVARSYNEGTAARTRPITFEEIMLRRKKKLAADDKERISSFTEYSVQEDVRHTTDKLGDTRANKSSKDLKDAIKGSTKKTKEKVTKVKSGDLENTIKHKLDSDVTDKSKSFYTKSRKVKERIDEYSNRRGKDGDNLGTSYMKEMDRKQLKYRMEKDKHDQRDRKLRGEMKRKEHSYADEKNRFEIDYSGSRRYDSGKLHHPEYGERNDRMRDDSYPYFEESKSKRRRSRSPQYERGRGRSVSFSPQAQKKSYHGREHEEKSRRKHDGDKHRISGSGSYNNVHHRKYSSGLGGYSPRKRRPEASVRSPSPTIPSPERKAAKWDQPPTEARNSGFGVLPPSVQLPANKINEPTSSAPVTPPAKIPMHIPTAEVPSLLMRASIDSVQLTQATRPMRRLYVENLPASASERTVVDFLNDLLMSSGINHVKGTTPCISCILNKEKNQALVEFLTPQDATSALSFDGRSFSGSLLKIRRPKDFVEATIGVEEKPKEEKQEARVVADIVNDSPDKILDYGIPKGLIVQVDLSKMKSLEIFRDLVHLKKNEQIFIGGISEAISSSMLMEIVSAFGDLKAYCFEFNKQLNGPCAFLEYADHAVTSKACAGLNGMKLGGCILTAVQALPDAQDEEKEEIIPCYDVPMHAKSLLAPATKVLQLKNLFNREEFSLLSESELEEVLEDIRLECTRFGTVKGVNIVRYRSNPATATETLETYLNGHSVKIETRVECPSNDIEQDRYIQSQEKAKRTGDISNGVDEDVQVNNDNPLKHIKESVVLCRIDDATFSEESKQADDMAVGEGTESEKAVSMKLEEIAADSDLFPGTAKLGVLNPEIEKDACHNNPVSEKAELTAYNNAEMIENTDSRNPSFSPKEVGVSKEDDQQVLVETISVQAKGIDKEGIDIRKDDKRGSDLGAFEPGSVFVEFLREEATCMAAHCLHGRTYGDQVVAAAFFSYDLYLERFRP